MENRYSMPFANAVTSAPAHGCTICLEGGTSFGALEYLDIYFGMFLMPPSPLAGEGWDKDK
jgi:hypothetical protein